MSKRVEKKALRIIGGQPATLLGARLQRLEDFIVERSKPGYLEGALEAAGMDGCTHVRTAGNKPDLQFPEAENPLDDERHSVFRRCCGKLQYASPKRPDLLYALKELGRHLAASREADFRCLKHTLRYVKGTLDLGMVHRISGSIEDLIGSCDSDWAGCHEARKSTCCGVIKWMNIFITSYSRTGRWPLK